MNLGIYGGALMMMVEQRSWLVIIHCINHRLELAIKDAVSDINNFQDCDNFTSIKNAAEAMNIT